MSMCAWSQDEYELESDNALISPCAPRHWRQRHDLKGVGAFHMLHVGLTVRLVTNAKDEAFCFGAVAESAASFSSC